MADKNNDTHLVIKRKYIKQALTENELDTFNVLLMKYCTRMYEIQYT